MRRRTPKFMVVKTIDGVQFGLFKISGFQWISNSGTPTRFELKDAERWAAQLGWGFEAVPCGSNGQ